MRYLQILLGNVLICFAYAFICVPNGILNGGVTSMAMILNHFLYFDVALWTTFLMIALVVFCYVFLGKAFFQGTLFSGMCYVILFDLFHLCPFLFDLPIVFTLPLASICVGVGYAICLHNHATTVGFDTLAIYLHQRNERFAIGTTMFVIQTLIMIAGSFGFGVSALWKGIIFVFLQTSIMDIILRYKEVSGYGSETV